MRPPLETSKAAAHPDVASLTSMGDEIYTEFDKLKKDTGINPNIVRIYSGQNVIAVPAQ